MFGGTPSNISLSFLEKDRVEIITGVNLPMVVKFATLPQDGKDLTAVAHTISEKGSKAIRVASELLTAERRAPAGSNAAPRAKKKTACTAPPPRSARTPPR